ncbi:GTP cyclohydrolase FolE2 [Dyella sp. C11]|uniref:GTP cyclohydrolase FolE2 n=1 Tax=Dyella sp. C11 TaxID=2126991 RepID=UPI000D65B13D|nr:GTP cyclohydrolase FolE2 [Dyella sp. C11]
MPDVAVQPLLGGRLDWVGMEGIDAPLHIDAGNGSTQQVTAHVGAFVNLTRTDRRGIHMSRLYLLIDEHLGTSTLSPFTLERLLRAFLQSHHDLADRARLRLRFEQRVLRKALRSDHYGWRSYPVTVDATLGHHGIDITLSADVTYSSTCPASAALSRQLIQERFASDFPNAAPLHHADVLAWLGTEQGIVATPHAQRSIAQVSVRLAHDAPLDIIGLIDRVETTLGTPVQTAVKREDEQAFALANGANLMFCEDAARRIQRALDADEHFADFQVRVEHQESLHAHDAVAWASKHGAV